jgi:hypothetical protein
MPYLRLHLTEASIEQKRWIAQELIEITLRSFRLRRADRYRISIEFVSHSHDPAWPLGAPEADFVLEVLGHNLTRTQQRAFSAEATALLARVLPTKPEGRIARLLGIRANHQRDIAFEFHELSPAISDPFVVHPPSVAA